MVFVFRDTIVLMSDFSSVAPRSIILHSHFALVLFSVQASRSSKIQGNDGGVYQSMYRHVSEKKPNFLLH